MKKALITGITGQDGSYLAEFLFPPTLSSKSGANLQAVYIQDTQNLSDVFPSVSFLYRLSNL